MKAIVTVGYQAYLMPSIKAATDLLALLGKALPCQDCTYKDLVIIKGDQRLEMKVVPSGTKFRSAASDDQVDDSPSGEAVADPFEILKTRPIRRSSTPRPRREALPPPSQLFLE